MKIIVVAGKRSSVGKTALAERLLSKLSGYSAIKTTTIRKSRCPKEASDCNICDEFGGGFEIIEETKVINQKGTDSARLKKAGAKKVLWLKASLRGLRSGMEEAISKLSNSPGIIIEGTSVLKYLVPDLIFYLKGPEKKDLRTYGDNKSPWAKTITKFIEKEAGPASCRQSEG